MQVLILANLLRTTLRRYTGRLSVKEGMEGTSWYPAEYKLPPSNFPKIVCLYNDNVLAPPHIVKYTCDCRNKFHFWGKLDSWGGGGVGGWVGFPSTSPLDDLGYVRTDFDDSSNNSICRSEVRCGSRISQRYDYLSL